MLGEPGHGPGEKPQIVIQLEEKPVPLMTCAARRAFKNMTVQYMGQLLTSLSLKRLPKEIELAAALVEKVLGISAEAAMKIALQHRFGDKVAQPFSGNLASGANLDAVSHLFGQEDQEEVKKVVEKEKVARAKRMKTLSKEKAAKVKETSAAGAEGASSSSAAAGSSSSGSSGPGAPPTSGGAVQWPRQSGVTPAWAKRLLPQVPGCRIAKDNRRHFRWEVTYPRAEPPYSRSCGFGRAGAENEEAVRAALARCIHWAWQQHVDAGGEPMPFSL